MIIISVRVFYFLCSHHYIGLNYTSLEKHSLIHSGPSLNILSFHQQFKQIYGPSGKMRQVFYIYLSKSGKSNIRLKLASL